MSISCQRRPGTIERSARSTDKTNAIPKIVFSKPLDRAPWGEYPEARVVRNSATDEVAAMKRQSGKNMIV